MKRCLVYLVDPIHNYISGRDNWMIPLNALLISAYTRNVLGEKVDIRVFKLPNLVLEAIKAEPPDIIGVSNYLWNSELSKLILRFAKDRRADTVTVMGGPNVVETAPFMGSFLRTAGCDYYVSGAGEHPFMCLVKGWLESGNDVPLHRNEGVHGVWYLNEKNTAVLKPVTHTVENLDEISSPFQNGMVDEFFAQGLTPMLETNRGCPFSCTYCVWGTGHKVYKYSVERVKADIDYCRAHARDGLLMLNDANFGLFADRDVEIARFIQNLTQKYNWPRTVVVNWGQVKSEDALKVADILRDVCMLRQSSQSLNPVVLKNIKRQNMTDEQWHAVIDFCEQQGIDSFGELILMLPGETMTSYLDGLRYLFGLGIESINTNQLQLLDGSVMNTPEERAYYGMETRWRLLENCYGKYEGRVAIEAEEIVVQTDTFSRGESLECRPLNWLIQMSWTLRRHDLLLRLMSGFGISPVDFLLKAVREHGRAGGRVKELFDAFIRDAEAELFPTRQALVNAYSTDEKISLLRSGGFRKLNTYYSGIERECSEDFVAYYVDIALDLLKMQKNPPSHYREQITECARFLSQRNISLGELKRIEAGKEVEKIVHFDYDIFSWDKTGGGQQMAAFYVPGGVAYRFFVEDQQSADLCRHMQRFSGMTREYQLRKLHEPYYGIRKENLLFQVAPAPL
jgi:radical SAM superfamily enzyme YgiQ (UPF0313 family)